MFMFWGFYQNMFSGFCICLWGFIYEYFRSFCKILPILQVRRLEAWVEASIVEIDDIVVPIALVGVARAVAVRIA